MNNIPRTARQAYGHDICFTKDPDVTVFKVCVVCAAFIVGMMIGGVL